MNKRILFLSVVLVLLVSVAPSALAQSDCDFSFSNYARAVQLHDMGDYGRALWHYDCALLENPDDSIIPMLIDNVYEDVESAGSAWDAPNQPLCDPARDHGALGATAFERGENSRAQTHLHCVLLENPADLAALTLMGRIHANLGDAHSARHYFDRADAAQGEQSDQPAGFVMPDWLTPYETVPKRNVQSTAGVNASGELALAPDARRIHIVSIVARITFPAADSVADAREQARQAGRRGDSDAALKSTQQVTDADDATADDFANLASLYSMRGDMAAMERSLIAALELEPNRLDLRCSLGMAYVAQGETQAAYAQFDWILSQDVSDICANENRRALGRALNAEMPPAQLAASPAQETFARGLELLAAGKRYAAANTFLTALETDPEHQAARCQLGVILTDWANYSGALTQFNRVLAADAQDDCARQNRKVAILRMLEMYIPLTVDDFFFHARTYVQVEEWQLARDAFERGLKRDAARTDARCELGVIYATLGDDRAALREFDRVLTHDAIDPCARSNRDGLMQRLRGDR